MVKSIETEHVDCRRSMSWGEYGNEPSFVPAVTRNVVEWLAMTMHWYGILRIARKLIDDYPSGFDSFDDEFALILNVSVCV